MPSLTPASGLRPWRPPISSWADFFGWSDDRRCGRNCNRGDLRDLSVHEGPPPECRRVAPGPLLVGVRRKHRKNAGGKRTPHRMQKGGSRAASGGGGAKTRKNTGFLGR
jgi:hypothetical protein